jgi:hypothetical protein
MLPSALGGESAPLSDFGKNYTSKRDEITHAADEGLREHPIAGRVAELAGTAVTSLPMLAERTLADGAMKALVEPMGKRMLKSAAVGAGVGGTAGAGAATGGVGDYAKSIGTGAAGGAVLGAAAPPIASVVGKAPAVR